MLRLKEMKKLVGLRPESELPNDEGNEFSESVALLTKNFEIAIKSLNTQAKKVILKPLNLVLVLLILQSLA